MKSKTRLVIKNLFILEIGFLSFILAMSDWIIALFQNGTFTVFGLLINIIELLVSVMCYEYLEDYLNNKEVR